MYLLDKIESFLFLLTFASQNGSSTSKPLTSILNYHLRDYLINYSLISTEPQKKLNCY